MAQTLTVLEDDMLDLPVFDKGEFARRVETLQRHLGSTQIDAVLLTHRVNRYYFTGTAQNGYAVIGREGEPHVFIRKDMERATGECVWPVEYLDSVRELPKAMAAKMGRTPTHIGVETDILPVVQFERLQKLFTGASFSNSSHPIMLTRAVKSENEIEAMRCACVMVREGAATAAKVLRAGMTELELAAHIEYRMRILGHGGYTPMRSFNHWLFYGHVMAGQSAAQAGGFDMPTQGRGLSPLISQSASTRVIKEGEPVSVDLVGNCGGYLCDQTRLFSVGPLDPAFARAFEVAVRIQEKVAKHARPGAVASDLYEMAVREAAESGLGANFLGDGDAVSFVGHGIGLEVDEYPFLADRFQMKLEEGMVFALEPKFIFKGRGAVGIEDTFVVRADGAERLTTAPREIIFV